MHFQTNRSLAGVRMELSEINGILNVLKPPGMTSHDVISFLRRRMKIKKAGHTGTLDPGVAGVLPVCLGRATKIIEFMSEDSKEYRAEAVFGRATDTQDGFGQTVRISDASFLTEDSVREALAAFQGVREQVPPMVSALKHKGRKLYELAREGIEVARESRKIEIYQMSIIKFSEFGSPNPSVIFDIECSRGTYVRTICHDLGEMLASCAYMSFLVRTRTGMFKLDEALTLEEIDDKISRGSIGEAVIPVEQVVPLADVWIYDSAVKSVVHGNKVYIAGVEKMPGELVENSLVKLMNRSYGCLAVAKFLDKNAFQPVKVLAKGEI